MKVGKLYLKKWRISIHKLKLFKRIHRNSGGEKHNNQSKKNYYKGTTANMNWQKKASKLKGPLRLSRLGEKEKNEGK